MITSVEMVALVFFVAAFGTTGSPVDNTELRVSSSCDVLYSTVEACHQFGSTSLDATECPAFGEEVRYSLARGIDGLGKELLQWIGEDCIEHCESGVNGRAVAAVETVCVPIDES